MSEISVSKRSENLIESIIEKFGENFERWEFVKMFKENGDECAQAVKINGNWFSYPDFKKKNKTDKVLVFVEVKGYDGYFADIEYGLGIKINQFKSYSKIQFEESSQVRICFVIWIDEKPFIFWETLNNMKKMEKQILKDYQFTKKSKPMDYYIFDCREFRTDYKNIPRFAWDE